MSPWSKSVRAILRTCSVARTVLLGVPSAVTERISAVRSKPAGLRRRPISAAVRCPLCGGKNVCAQRQVPAKPALDLSKAHRPGPVGGGGGDGGAGGGHGPIVAPWARSAVATDLRTVRLRPSGQIVTCRFLCFLFLGFLASVPANPRSSASPPPLARPPSSRARPRRV